MCVCPEWHSRCDSWTLARPLQHPHFPTWRKKAKVPACLGPPGGVEGRGRTWTPCPPLWRYRSWRGCLHTVHQLVCVSLWQLQETPHPMWAHQYTITQGGSTWQVNIELWHLAWGNRLWLLSNTDFAAETRHSLVPVSLATFLCFISSWIESFFFFNKTSFLKKPSWAAWTFDGNFSHSDDRLFNNKHKC